MRMDAFYERHEKLLRKLAWEFCRRFGHDCDDLFGEACLALVKIAPKYDASRGAESTFVWRAITNALQGYCNHERKHEHADLEYAMNIPSTAPTADHVTEFRQTMAGLSTAAYSTAWLAINHPAALGITTADTACQQRVKARRHIGKQYKVYEKASVRAIMTEIKTAVMQ